MKAYLGDAVYADWDHGDLVLTTEDGIRATNTIVLEYDVIVALLAYLSRSEELPKGLADRLRRVDSII